MRGFNFFTVKPPAGFNPTNHNRPSPAAPATHLLKLIEHLHHGRAAYDKQPGHGLFTPAPSGG